MPPRIGYLLPTREQVMQGRPEAAPLLAPWPNAPWVSAMIRSR